jgi:hypothetical protein
MEEIFESETNSAETLAGVFEFDGEASYFYLYKILEGDEYEILNNIRIQINSSPDFNSSDIEILWQSRDRFLCLKIKNIIWAVFDIQSNQTYGGNYSLNEVPKIPLTICKMIQE